MFTTDLIGEASEVRQRGLDQKVRATHVGRDMLIELVCIPVL